MAPWCACGWIGKRRRSRCWPSLGCVPRARKCSWLSKHGRREHRGLADSARRSCRARPTAVGIPDRRRRAWARECDRGGLDGVPVQRCTVHKHRNLLAHAPERLHEEISADYNGMIYAATREEVDRRVPRGVISLHHLIREKRMVKCSKDEVRRLKTALRWKILAAQRNASRWCCCVKVG